MGAVMATLKLTNWSDFIRVKEGQLEPGRARTLEIEALVDTGSVDMVLPEDVVEALGLVEIGRLSVRLADGSRRVLPKVGGLFLEIFNRCASTDAYVVPRGAPALLGQIQLEALDVIVDPRSQEIRVNPDSPDQQSSYIYSAA
jgi:predicted aspartyl protease